ncbi:LOW QUALITY PROTEIN: hypothetical protein PHMEG_0009744 [Phytophthora megakarya]|uniref:Uncharacterized protein n=1 Tax=Phytophthora megakarya TaxID=4795 RepID=A0A225WHV9_9STRA|nr:LOW QUALITY PROTEIN: hypothetical protein PHMEG_0009744 [Phytophthora megakarya]
MAPRTDSTNDHKSNYCSVFAARNKAAAAKPFEHVLVISEKIFDCKAPEEASRGLWLRTGVWRGLQRHVRGGDRHRQVDFGSGKEVADPCKTRGRSERLREGGQRSRAGFLDATPSRVRDFKGEMKKLGVTGEEEQVLELQEALFRLKQAGRLSSKILQQKPHDTGFRQSLTDMCVYYRWDEGLYSW